MTKKIFWQDPYLTQLETRIVSVDGDDVTVEETIWQASSNRITYVFEKGLPEGSLGPGWTWAIKTYDRCTKTREELHIPVDQLVPCEAN